MSDHAINIALLVVGMITGLFEAGIAWMILQDYRKIREMPELSFKRWSLMGMFSLGPLLALFVIYLFGANLRPKVQTQTQQAAAIESVKGVPTDLRLQFNALNTMPLAVSQHNIWRWYTLRTSFQGIDAKTKKLTEGGSTWTIFVTFDTPVAFKQIRIDSGGSPLPRYEVKDSSQRTVIVVFSGELAGTIVDIQAI
jgi:hypothetical protein